MKLLMYQLLAYAIPLFVISVIFNLNILFVFVAIPLLKILIAAIIK